MSNDKLKNNDLTWYEMLIEKICNYLADGLDQNYGPFAILGRKYFFFCLVNIWLKIQYIMNMST